MDDNIKPTLAVMAAGLGQRYGGLKQLTPVYGDPVNGHILLEYAVYDALREGFGEIVILIRKDFKDVFMEKYGKRIEEGAKWFSADVNYVYQESLLEIQKTLPFRKKMWGTGYAALCFGEVIKEPVAIINADNFYGREPFRLLHNFFNSKDYNPNGNVHALVGYRLKNVIHTNDPVAEAICKVSSAGFLESIVERTEIISQGDRIVYRENDIGHPLDPDTIVSTNLWGFNSTIFSELRAGYEKFITDVRKNEDPKKEFYLPNFIGELLAKGRIKVKVLPTGERCFGMTYEKQKASIQAEIQRLTDKGLYPDKLWDGKN